MPNLTPSEIRAALAVCERATPGPWKFKPKMWNTGDETERLPHSRGSIVADTEDEWYIAGVDNPPGEAANADLIALARTLLPRALKELWERAEDTERLDDLERMAQESVKRTFDMKAGFVVSEDGDVLSGVCEDYPHKTLRAAIDAARQGDQHA